MVDCFFYVFIVYFAGFDQTKRNLKIYEACKPLFIKRLT